MSSTATPTGERPGAIPSSPRVDDGSGDDVEPLSQDVAFEMLSCRRRRDVLHYLRQNGGTAELRPLSRQIAAWENDEPIEAVTYKQRSRVYTALRQAHLPKMDSYGIVEFDADRGTVALTGRASDLDVYLDVIPHGDVSWSTYYVVLGGFSIAFAALILLTSFPFGLLPTGAGVLILGVLYLGSAIAHRLYERRTQIGSDGRRPG
ncbi:hypothetical protein ACFO5R_07300 [Halosolutus amylolyticus]|uniref:DUF7344 domain-containing protein n=1 Tax=Halosolutus amylolyticus TaxID=2932267 RepID=A0ABD5PMC6_9EURY|nr:hypothetical protein [Halosolutus amylolyticus]